MSSAEHQFDRDIHAPERLGFIICFATLMHLAVILGISFTAGSVDARLPSLEVTLARYRSQQAPDQADFIAQHDQQGSGTQGDKAELSSRQQSAFHDNAVPDSDILKLAKDAPTQQDALLTTVGDSPRRVPSKISDAPDTASQKERFQGEDDRTQLSEDIAALEAQLDDLNQAYAKLPRPKFITSVATRGSADARYLHRWESHVEAVGNANYPDEARRQGLEGELRLLLMLFPDGRIDEVRILSGSGHTILDRAAHRIVRLAAPYEAVPAEVLDGKNRLGIVRTWRFDRGGLEAR